MITRSVSISRTARFAKLVALGCIGATAVADAELRDPTRPYTVPEFVNIAGPRFEVNAIFSSSNRGVAIVNGQRVTVGSQVDGATVLEISKDAVTLDVDGERRILTVRGGVQTQ